MKAIENLVGGMNMIPLNKWLKKVVYPITSLEEITNFLYGMKFLSSMDVQSAYNIVSIHPEKRHLFSFQTPYGSYQCCSLAMGAQASSGVFLSIMDVILHDVKFRGMANYVDDLL